MRARHNHGSDSDSTQALARGLGWFSIGLGLAEVMAPRLLARSLGMRGSEPVLVAYGLREIVTGIGALTSRNPAPWIWGRVAGDALDMATLAPGASRGNRKLGNLAVALASVAGVAVLDVICATALSGDRRHGRHRSAVRDYSDRRGMPRHMRGAARNFEVPRDVRGPDELRSFRAR